ncbi:MAG: hypothetical protein GY715_18980 [Planctomycetes bacterium]|nr:hypothetical protein [Planctomycetota bacterium]
MNRCPFAFTALAAVVALAGCKANPSGRSPVDPPPLEPAPIRDPAPPPRRDLAGPPVFIDPEDVAVTGSVLHSNTDYETNVPLKLAFSPTAVGRSDFVALVGPMPTSGTSAEWEVASPAYDIVIDEGFVYMSGTRPHGTTGKGGVTSDGTWLIMQTGELRDRFFLLHAPPGKSMTVRSLTGTTLKEVSMPLSYVEVDDIGTITGPTSIPHDPTDPIHLFVDSVVAQGTAAGIDPPPNWPPGP